MCPWGKIAGTGRLSQAVSCFLSRPARRAWRRVLRVLSRPREAVIVGFLHQCCLLSLPRPPSLNSLWVQLTVATAPPVAAREPLGAVADPVWHSAVRTRVARRSMRRSHGSRSSPSVPRHTSPGRGSRDRCPRAPQAPAPAVHRGICAPAHAPAPAPSSDATPDNGDDKPCTHRHAPLLTKVDTGRVSLAVQVPKPPVGVHTALWRRGPWMRSVSAPGGRLAQTVPPAQSVQPWDRRADGLPVSASGVSDPAQRDSDGRRRRDGCRRRTDWMGSVRINAGISSCLPSRSSASFRSVATNASACDASYLVRAGVGEPATGSRRRTGFSLAGPGAKFSISTS